MGQPKQREAPSRPRRRRGCAAFSSCRRIRANSEKGAFAAAVISLKMSLPLADVFGKRCGQIGSPFGRVIV
jgi:hypothetical protein